MNAPFSFFSQLFSRTFVLLLVGFGLLLPGRLLAQATPEGTWDFTVLGVDRGMANFTFFDDATVEGFIFLRPAPSTNGFTARQFGFFLVTGVWQTDSRGRVFVNFATDPAEGLNTGELSASLRGRVTRGNRLVLRGRDDNGGLLLRGVPSEAEFAPDVTGPRILDGAFRDENDTRQVFFDSVDVFPTEFPGLSEISGHGPGYTVEGFIFITSRNSMAIMFRAVFPGTETDPDGGVLTRSVSGRFNPRANRALLIGVTDREDGALTGSRVRFLTP